MFKFWGNLEFLQKSFMTSTSAPVVNVIKLFLEEIPKFEISEK